MPVHAFIFPGQGSQSVGMGRDLAAAFAAAREVFGEVDDTLNQKLSKLMFEGPAEELTLTENTQPALMAMSLAVLRVLEAEGGVPLKDEAALVAGHSLGEYSALAAAGSLRVAECARLLRLRGEAMQRRCRPGRAPWPPCWAPTWRRRAPSARKRRRARWSRRPTTMAAARW